MNKLKQLGQGMTEYIIIVALIAIAGIAAYSFFGQAIQGQVSNMTEEISGNEATDAGKAAAIAGAQGAAAANENMGTYDEEANK